MKLSINTNTLKEMVSKSVKGASNNKLRPLTSLMSIELKNGTLTLTTTDGTNYLYIIDKNIDGDDFYVVVEVDKFSKLVSKFTNEITTLEVDNGNLIVNGNGRYTLEVPLDEDGNVVNYPNPLNEFGEVIPQTSITITDIKTVLNSIKPSLAVKMEDVMLTGYYVGDIVVATDRYKVAGLDAKLCAKPHIINATTFNLLDIVTDDKIMVHESGNKIVFSTPNCIVYGVTMDNVDNYPIEPIKGLLEDSSFNGKCEIAKATILNSLDRIALFVSAYDDNAIKLVFSDDGIEISSKSTNGVENIDYVDTNEHPAFVCEIDIDVLSTQIRAQSNDTITMYYGNESTLKFVDNNITLLAALYED